ncbi:MAG: ABC transporter ATP-binding protein [Patescibacteria group bacterium]
MKYNTKQTLKIYWQYAMRYKIAVFFVVLTTIGASIINVVTPLYYKKFFDVISSGLDKQSLGSQLITIIIYVLVLDVVSWICWRVATFTASYFQAHVMADLSNYCFAYLHKHSFAYFNNNFVGSLVKRVKWFTAAFEDISDRIIWDIIVLIVNLVGILYVLYTRNALLALAMIIWVAIFMVFNWVFVRYKYKFDVARNEAETESSGLLADTITNNANVKLFNGYKKELKSFALITKKLRDLRKFAWYLGGYFESAQGAMGVILDFVIFYIAIKLWQKNLLTIGDFVLIQAYIINIISRVWGFGRMIQKVYEKLSDAEEMTVVLTTPHEIQDIPEAKDLIVKQGKIEFQNVNFNYHQTRKVLSNFNLTIMPGEKIALVGPSGAGKTTIARVLLRMYDLTSGKILIDGQNIAKVTQESLWRNISKVPQDPILFHRSLMENIRYGNFKATDKEVIQASKLAYCHEFISKLSDGYSTFVGERGIKLSGGERQRVAIARAILHNTPILILDEATSSLDSESEMLIQKALDELMKDKTVIAIAHRLSTIRKMDRIIVIGEKGIIEEGTHESLIAQKEGLYKKLWGLQAGGFIQ